MKRHLHRRYLGYIGGLGNYFYNSLLNRFHLNIYNNTKIKIITIILVKLKIQHSAIIIILALI